MGAKAVYDSGTLAVYVTRADLDALLNDGILTVDLLVRGDILTRDAVSVYLPVGRSEALMQIVLAERAAFAAGRLAWQTGELKPVPPVKRKRRKPKEAQHA